MQDKMQPYTDIKPSDPEAIAESMIPAQDGYGHEGKEKYLSLIACGFKTKEATEMVGINLRTVYRWREDPKFLKTEDDARGELRRKMATEYVNIEFTRNYTLALEKDFKIFQLSLGGSGELTKQQHEYLLRARSHYTPQQLQILHQLIRVGTDGGEMTFEDVVRSIAARGEVRVELTQNKAVIEGRDNREGGYSG